jgi:BolA family transcriptional regulator, general stress-responsive regulator
MKPTMSIAQHIQSKLEHAFAPIHLEVINESHMHRMQASESHFKVIVVSETFVGMRLMQAHQAVYRVLQDEMQQIHALALHTYEPQQWSSHQMKMDSPPCIKK